MSKNKNKTNQKKAKVSLENRVGKITAIKQLSYIAEVLCWCGNSLTIDSSKSLEENTCSNCRCPYKLLNEEWTEEERIKFLKLEQTIQETQSCQ